MSGKHKEENNYLPPRPKGHPSFPKEGNWDEELPQILLLAKEEYPKGEVVGKLKKKNYETNHYKFFVLSVT